ncbi:MAG: thermonuclease family protein [Firmicutes bacterium]|nr:thermonuclease family protein [Bacillota bacterium]MCL5038907.1 thermonuclease family protein [Bacillota bacterium]
MPFPTRRQRKGYDRPERGASTWAISLLTGVLVLGAVSERNLGGLVAALTLWLSLVLFFDLYPWTSIPARNRPGGRHRRVGLTILLLTLAILGFSLVEGYFDLMQARRQVEEALHRGLAHLMGQVPGAPSLLGNPEFGRQGDQRKTGAEKAPRAEEPQPSITRAGTEKALAFPIGLEPGQPIPALVTRVVDPGTLILDGKVKAKLAGLAPPPRESPAYEEALLYLKVLVGQEQVEVSFCPYNQDSEELYAVVSFRGQSLNLELLERGLALVNKTAGSDFDLLTWELKERTAQKNRRGFWTAVR